MILVAIGAMALVGTPANADDADPSEVPNAEEVEINGRTYGPEDGLVVEGGSVILDRQDVESESPNSAALRAPTTFTRGTSYVSTDHPTPFTYEGKARAMANIYNGLRVIRAEFVYKRGGQPVIAPQHSDAIVDSSCNWSAGPEEGHTVIDSMDPNAPVTTFHYDFTSINPSIC